MSTNSNKCRQCPNRKCCQYVTQQIDTPRKKIDFQALLWQVSHEQVEVYKDSDGWFLLFISPCTHLDERGHCQIYTQRPAVCQDYDNDYCELDAPAEEGFDLYFQNYQQLLAYCQKRFKKWP